jgi:hypothetical protein
MNSLLLELMSGDANPNRAFSSLLLLGIVDFCCILIGLEQISIGKYGSGAVWAIVGIGSGLVGYYLPRLTKKTSSGLKVTDAAMQDTPVVNVLSGQVVDHRTFVQIAVKCVTGAVYECEGHLLRVLRFTSGGWMPTALNESLRLGWSYRDNEPKITQQPGAEHNLNIFFIAHNDCSIVLCAIDGVPTKAGGVFGSATERSGSAYQFHVQISNSERVDGEMKPSKPVNACLEVYFENDPFAPHLELNESL